MRKNVLFTIIIVLITLMKSQIYAQVGKTIDSLNEQSIFLRKVNPDASLVLGRKALLLSRQHGLREKEFTSLSTLCLTCYENQRYDLSIPYCQEATQFTGVDNSHKIHSYVSLGLSNVHLGNYNKAITSYLRY